MPGTAPLDKIRDCGLPEDRPATELALKYDKSGTTVLIPQPSDDPNDPLNWPRWRKELFLLSIIWGTACVASKYCYQSVYTERFHLLMLSIALGPLLAAAYVQLAEEWKVSLAQFSIGTNGSLIIALAAATLVFNVLAVQYGKRPIYLASSVGLIAASFWSSAATTFGSFVASRAVAGICMAPLEALPPASIADVW